MCYRCPRSHPRILKSVKSFALYINVKLIMVFSKVNSSNSCSMNGREFQCYILCCCYLRTTHISVCVCYSLLLLCIFVLFVCILWASNIMEYVHMYVFAMTHIIINTQTSSKCPTKLFTSSAIAVRLYYATLLRMVL